MHLYFINRTKRFRFIFRAIKKNSSGDARTCIYCKKSLRQSHHVSRSRIIITTDHFVPFIREAAPVCTHRSSIEPRRRLFARRPSRRGMRICLREYRQLGIVVRPLVEGSLSSGVQLAFAPPRPGHSRGVGFP